MAGDRNENASKSFWKHFKMLSLILFTYLRYYLDLLIDKMFGFYYDSFAKKVPPISNEILLESASNLALKIRQRDISCTHLVQAFIDRIREVNDLINAVVDERFDEALKEARNIDLKLSEGESFSDQPFLGVPFTAKESTNCNKMSTTFGLKCRLNFKGSFDADIVANLKNSGAILLAVTNVPQINLWQETFNPIFGLTKNPYNTSRTVGGSSGGEAAIVAACGSPIGLGTDIGGSLRIPGFMCGLFSHKPTCGIVSTNGLTYRDGTELNTMVVAGPIVKHSQDLAPLLKCLIKKNVSIDLTDFDCSKINFYYVTTPNDPFVCTIRREMVHLQLNVIRKLTEKLGGKKPELVSFDEFKFGGKIWRYWLSQEPNSDLNKDLSNRTTPVKTWRELLKFVTRTSDFSISAILLMLNNLLPAEDSEWARGITETLVNKLSTILGTNGVLLYPSAPFPANYHYTAVLRPWNLNLFAIWNALKFPVTQVPLGLSQDGLPMGIQVVAAPFQDRLCLSVAKELETLFGGYTPPS